MRELYGCTIIPMTRSNIFQILFLIILGTPDHEYENKMYSTL